MAHLLQRLRHAVPPLAQQAQSSNRYSSDYYSSIYSNRANRQSAESPISSSYSSDELSFASSANVASSLASASSSAAGYSDPVPEYARHHLALEALQLYVPISNALGLTAAFKELEELGYRVIESQ